MLWLERKSCSSTPSCPSSPAGGPPWCWGSCRCWGRVGPGVWGWTTSWRKSCLWSHLIHIERAVSVSLDICLCPCWGCRACSTRWEHTSVNMKSSFCLDTFPIVTSVWVVGQQEVVMAGRGGRGVVSLTAVQSLSEPPRSAGLRADRCGQSQR